MIQRYNSQIVSGPGTPQNFEPVRRVREDSQTDKQLNFHALRNAGIDIRSYPREFIESEELTEILSSKNLLVLDADDKVNTTRLKKLLNELAVKYSHQQPLIADTNFDYKTDVVDILKKIHSVLEDKVKLSATAELNNLIVDIDISSKNQSRIDEKTVLQLQSHLSAITSEIKQREDKERLRELSETITLLSQRLASPILAEKKQNLIDSITSHLKNIDKPGGSINTEGSMGFLLPQAIMGLFFSSTASHTQSLKMNDSRELWDSSQYSIDISTNAGLLKTAEGRAGIGVSRESADVYESVEDFLDKNIESFLKKPFFSQLSSEVRNDVKKLIDLTKQENKIIDQHDRLEGKLTRLGVLSEGGKIGLEIKERKQTHTRRSHNLEGHLGVWASGLQEKVFAEARVQMQGKLYEELNRSKIITQLDTNPEYLSQMQTKHGIDKLENLTEQLHQINSIRDIEALPETRHQLKKSILNNFSEFQQTLRSMRLQANITQGQGNWLENFISHITGKKDSSSSDMGDTIRKLDPKALGTNLEALAVRHVTLTKAYQQTMISEITQPRQGSEQWQQEKLFAEALGAMHTSFERPNINLNQHNQGVLSTVAKVTIPQVQTQGQIDLSSIFGPGAKVSASHTYFNHPNPIKAGRSVNYRFEGLVSVNPENLSLTLSMLANRVPQDVLSQIKDVFIQYQSHNFEKSISTDILFTNGKLSYIRPIDNASLGVRLGLGDAVNIGLQQSHSAPRMERIGDDSYNYPLLQFDAFKNYGEIESNSPDRNDWIKFCLSHPEEFSTLFRKQIDVNSYPAGEIKAMLEDNREYYSPEETEAMESAIAAFTHSCERLGM